MKAFPKKTHLSSASLANLASGNTLILIKSPPQALYIKLSALVENCGPSIQTIHLSVNNPTPLPSSSKAFFTLPSNHLTNFPLNGSPNIACATTVESWKNDEGRMPLVRSMIWFGRMNEPGDISSRKDPTAEKARTVRMPRDLKAAMLAREGTEEGEMVCDGP